MCAWRTVDIAIQARDEASAVLGGVQSQFASFAGHLLRMSTILQTARAGLEIFRALGAASRDDWQGINAALEKLPAGTGEFYKEAHQCALEWTSIGREILHVNAEGERLKAWSKEFRAIWEGGQSWQFKASLIGLSDMEVQIATVRQQHAEARRKFTEEARASAERGGPSLQSDTVRGTLRDIARVEEEEITQIRRKAAQRSEEHRNDLDVQIAEAVGSQGRTDLEQRLAQARHQYEVFIRGLRDQGRLNPERQQQLRDWLQAEEKTARDEAAKRDADTRKKQADQEAELIRDLTGRRFDLEHDAQARELRALDEHFAELTRRHRDNAAMIAKIDQEHAFEREKLLERQQREALKAKEDAMRDLTGMKRAMGGADEDRRGPAAQEARFLTGVRSQDPAAEAVKKLGEIHQALSQARQGIQELVRQGDRSGNVRIAKYPAAV